MTEQELRLAEGVEEVLASYYVPSGETLVVSGALVGPLLVKRRRKDGVG